MIGSILMLLAVFETIMAGYHANAYAEGNVESLGPCICSSIAAIMLAIFCTGHGIATVIQGIVKELKETEWKAEGKWAHPSATGATHKEEK